MDCIGRKRFSGISLDSTGNTKKACKIVAKVCPWIIILPDASHLINNTAKDIQKLEYFKNVSTMIQNASPSRL